MGNFGARPGLQSCNCSFARALGHVDCPPARPIPHTPLTPSLLVCIVVLVLKCHVWIMAHVLPQTQKPCVQAIPRLFQTSLDAPVFFRAGCGESTFDFDHTRTAARREPTRARSCAKGRPLARCNADATARARGCTFRDLSSCFLILHSSDPRDCHSPPGSLPRRTPQERRR